MRDFKAFMERNREKVYAVAHANCKHDAAGHCLFPKDDAWMKDDVWDKNAEKWSGEEHHKPCGKSRKFNRKRFGLRGFAMKKTRKKENIAPFLV